MLLSAGGAVSSPRYNISPPSLLSDPFPRKPLSSSFFFSRPPSPNSRPRGQSRVSAALRRGPKPRRNILREKFLSRNAQVLPKPSLSQNSPPPTLDRVVEDKIVDDYSTGESSDASSDVLWSKLEKWVEQFKEDNDLWGVGSGPVFRVYKDSDGRIVRVSVDEDEIVRRSAIGAEAGEEEDVAAKIRRAKVIAGEIASGEYVVPENSSVVEFVEEGMESSSLDQTSYVSPPGERSRMLGRLAFVVVCGCAVFWVAQRLWGVQGKAELTSLEMEMLRRKLKARRQRGMVVEGSVEVFQDDDAVPMVDFPRPGLDREELQKSILNTNIPKPIPDRSSLLDQHFGKDHSFEDKVKEIREMARKARESERQARQGDSEEVEEDFQTGNGSFPSVSSSLETPQVAGESVDSIGNAEKSFSDSGGGANGKDKMPHDGLGSKEEVRDSRKAHGLERQESQGNGEELQDDFQTGNGSLPSASSFLEHPEVVEESVNSTVEVEKALSDFGGKTDGKEQMSHTGLGSKEEFRNSRIRQELQGNSEEVQCDFKMENGALYTIRSSVEPPELVKKSVDSTVDVVKTFSDSGGDADEKKLLSHNELRSKEEARDPVSSDLSSSSKNFSAIAKPKIIRSVNEAREYLARKKKRKDGFSVPPQQLVLGKQQIGSNLHGSGNKIDASRAKGRKNTTRMNGSFDQQHLDLSGNKQTEAANFKSKENRSMEMGLGSRNIHGHLLDPSIVTENINPSFGSIGGKPDIPHSSHMEFSLSDLTEEGDKSPNIQTNISSKGSEAPANGSSAGIQDANGESPINRKEDERPDMEVDPPSTIFSTNNVVAKEDNIENVPRNLEKKDDKSPEISASKVVNGNNINLDNTHSSAFDEGTGKLSNNHNPKPQLKQARKKNWIKENLHELEPIIQKFGEGFRENYAMAKQKAPDPDMLNVHPSELDLVNGDDEIEWMKDEKLKEIVFKVRENELAGKDPFDSMTADDQQAFFRGLEKKAEKLNKKLSALHEYLHSRIENIDYGADGISLYDPPEKIVPRWKGPVVDRYPGFLKNSQQSRQVPFSSIKEKSSASNGNEEKPSLSSDGDLPTISVDASINKSQDGASSISGTVIECSDGSKKVGKKGGKEHWEHTKKWSRGFLEVYNAETDPEVKSILKDMGKDLDRWITEEELEDAAKLLTDIPQRQREFIQKKIDRVKREMEMYGPQAVVSKYREYSDEKEEDYLWWLDLKYVLCIELYTVKDDTQRIGFYSLEMASDLELDPKQFHVVAFEDRGDSKNFCYIIQAHLEMLGNGNAFVVALPPKDAFREAKSNGFHVTVIRKGQLKLNIDRPLQDVEEEIIEIGSRIYHEKIMKERSINIDTVMKGLLVSERSTKR